MVLFNKEYKPIYVNQRQTNKIDGMWIMRRHYEEGFNAFCAMLVNGIAI